MKFWIFILIFFGKGKAVENDQSSSFDRDDESRENMDILNKGYKPNQPGNFFGILSFY